MQWARIFMTDLALESELCGEIRLYDIDSEAAKCNEIIGNRLSADPRFCGKWHYTAVSSLQDALIGVDFVVISILPGRIELMQSDVHLPERHGIYQSVGDSTGPGGIIRALRTIPIFVGLAEAIRMYAPHAWVINYTNPMALSLRTLYRVFPEIKAFGCCHEVFGTQELLASMVEAETGNNVHRGDIHVNVIGLNHFTWFSHASYKDMNLLELFSRFSDTHYDVGFSPPHDKQLDDVFVCNNRVKFDLFRRYGLIAAAGDRHLAEFMPGETYLKNPSMAEAWGFRLTSGDWRVADRARKLEHTKRLLSGEEKLRSQPSGEEGLLLIKALCGLTRTVSNVNLPNSSGQIENLPRESVVETNALFSRDDVRPINAGSLSDDLQRVMLPHVENQTSILNAAFDCDKDAVCQAFKRDPLVNGKCTKQDVQILVDDMIQNTIEVLPDGWKTQ